MGKDCDMEVSVEGEGGEIRRRKPQQQRCLLQSMKCPICDTEHSYRSSILTSSDVQSAIMDRYGRGSNNNNDSSTTKIRKENRCSHNARVIFINGSCPVCLKKGVDPPMVALACGHIVCRDDFADLGGVMGKDIVVEEKSPNDDDTNKNKKKKTKFTTTNATNKNTTNNNTSPHHSEDNGCWVITPGEDESDWNLQRLYFNEQLSQICVRSSTTLNVNDAELVTCFDGSTWILSWTDGEEVGDDGESILTHVDLSGNVCDKYVLGEDFYESAVDVKADSNKNVFALVYDVNEKEEEVCNLVCINKQYPKGKIIVKGMADDRTEHIFASGNTEGVFLLVTSECDISEGLYFVTPEETKLVSSEVNQESWINYDNDGEGVLIFNPKEDDDDTVTLTHIKKDGTTTQQIIQTPLLNTDIKDTCTGSTTDTEGVYVLSYWRKDHGQAKLGCARVGAQYIEEECIFPRDIRNIFACGNGGIWTWSDELPFSGEGPSYLAFFNKRLGRYHEYSTSFPNGSRMQESFF